MEAAESPSQSAGVSVGSYDTALCIIPPTHLWPFINDLRLIYDKAYETWPPHINLIYPFVGVDSLLSASNVIVSRLKEWDRKDELRISLDAADVFSHRHGNTIFIYDQDANGASALKGLRKTMLEALERIPDGYQMHLTIGQSEQFNSSPHKFLLEKVKLLPKLEWGVDKLYILVRERVQDEKKAPSHMKIWGTVDLASLALSRMEKPISFHKGVEPTTPTDTNVDTTTTTQGGSQSRHPYIFSSAANKWVLYQTEPDSIDQELASKTLTVASYNVLAESHYPPSHARYPTLVRNLLDESSALADILVLQEVTVDFLSFLCQDSQIRKHYCFISNGPPNQADIGPLPSHLNVVVLSKWSFSWGWFSFRDLRKCFLIVKFDNIGKHNGDSFHPLILSDIQLTCGLTEASISKKKYELQSILDYLSKNYPQNPWILAGDFNITTSAHTIEAALQKNEISQPAVSDLNSLESILTGTGLVDSWISARVQYGDSSEPENPNEVFEGEQGATFDPAANKLATNSIQGGLDNRPQRFDRILFKRQNEFNVTSFNMFGQKIGNLDANPQANSDCDDSKSQAPETSHGSSHWGIRCSLDMATGISDQPSDGTNNLYVAIHPNAASATLADATELRHSLSRQSIIPSEEDITKRENAFSYLREILEGMYADQNGPGKSAFVVVPVGSYGLGVWTLSSDIDCLCIGPNSPETFFRLATQHLRRAAGKGVDILRRVNSWSGTILKLEVANVKIDLQYCPATTIAETFPHSMSLPSTNPVFQLKIDTLAKLKPVRDLYYLRRTIPDLAAFRTAHRLVKCWAKQRGIYAAKFGYLGGIQISLSLARVCKLLSYSGVPISVPTIVTTFFNHYAGFDWKKRVVFDPFFHKHLRYVRTAREPIAILGYHGPHLNTAHTASLPSVRSISDEFKRADALLSQDGMTWSRFLGEGSEATDFLTAYKSYIKINVLFWGVSSAKKTSFIGWLESKCATLLSDIGRRLPSIHVRIWPAPFIDEDASEEDTDYRGAYLTGLDEWETTERQSMTRDDKKVALDSLQAVLQRFESQVRDDEKYFDSKISWMSTEVVKASELGALRLDTREWGEYTIGDDESDEEEEEEDSHPDGTEDRDDEKVISNSKSRGKPPTSLPTRPAYTGKFRSSADVMNRLRWDQDKDSSDYIVGYEDRFLGMKERSLDLWKADQTDEEFIPQHRIMYFKRKSDGEIVWDRKARIDEIFKSGVSSLKPE
ncbi:hypothetical protein F4779DRAFT_618486 [Xylariaceae sp. FL0662B]|nr:hypothetical protein F4779DRAFT_618486 [Xylariaceae sp. FL0662B]